MRWLRRLARPMVAAMFVFGGWDALRNPAAKAPKARAVTDPLADDFPLAGDPVAAVRFNGAVQIAAGTLLGLSITPRLAALALAGSLLPTTYAGHRFWEETEPSTRAQQEVHFLKNVSMLGGLLFAISDGKK